MGRDEVGPTARLTIENLDTGNVTEREVRPEVAEAALALLKAAEEPHAPRPLKLRWAIDALLELEGRIREQYSEICASGEEDGWTADKLDRASAAEAGEAMIEDARAYLQDVRDGVGFGAKAWGAS